MLATQAVRFVTVAHATQNGSEGTWTGLWVRYLNVPTAGASQIAHRDWSLVAMVLYPSDTPWGLS